MRKSLYQDQKVLRSGKTECRQRQIPQDKHRFHYVKATVRVHEYSDESLTAFHGPRCLVHSQLENALKYRRKTKRQQARPMRLDLATGSDEPPLGPFSPVASPSRYPAVADRNLIPIPRHSDSYGGEAVFIAGSPTAGVTAAGGCGRSRAGRRRSPGRWPRARPGRA